MSAKESQKKSILKIVEKLLKPDLQDICIKFFVSKKGSKFTLKQRVVDLIEDNNRGIDWKTLKKEIKRVYKSNDKYKKSPKKCKKNKTSDPKCEESTESVDQLDAIDSTDTDDSRPPIVLTFAKEGQEVVIKQNNHSFNNLYFNCDQNSQLNTDLGNSLQMPSTSPSVLPLVPQNYTSADNPFSNLQFMDRYIDQLLTGTASPPTVAQNPNINPVSNAHPFPNPNPYSQQPIDYSLHNNYIHNQFQDINPDVLCPQNYGSFIAQQKLLLSQFQSKDTVNTDIPLSDDFWFKCLPKYRVIKNLVKAKTIGSLSDNGFEVNFTLSVLDLKPLSDESLNCLLNRLCYKVQLRFSYLNDSLTKEQKDCVPEYLAIEVNNQIVYQYSEKSETNSPFDLTEYCIYGTNKLKFSMTKENYTFLLPCLYEVSIVAYETPESLLLKLKQNAFHYMCPQLTKDIIQSRNESLSQDEVICDTNADTKVKLICPLSRRRIETPCRTMKCKHIECFDGLTFFRTNEFRYDWFCPICQKSAPFDSLRIDGYFTEILDKTDGSIDHLLIKSDGTYDVNKCNIESEVIDIDDIDSDSDTCAVIDAEGCIVID